ncbi:MAG: acetolactate synthase small subunit [Acidihalobacter sp.]
MRHIISILMENESGALSRVSGLFSARGYNIESLSVAPTNDPTLSRMTLVTSGNEAVIEQIVKQLNKLIDVTSEIYTVELTGTGEKLEAFMDAVGEGCILEVVRSGAMGIARGERVLKA